MKVRKMYRLFYVIRLKVQFIRSFEVNNFKQENCKLVETVFNVLFIFK